MAQFLWSDNDGASFPWFGKKKEQSLIHVCWPYFDNKLQTPQLAFKFPNSFNIEVQSLHASIRRCGLIMFPKAEHLAGNVEMLERTNKSIRMVSILWIFMLITKHTCYQTGDHKVQRIQAKTNFECYIMPLLLDSHLTAKIAGWKYFYRCCLEIKGPSAQCLLHVWCYRMKSNCVLSHLHERNERNKSYYSTTPFLRKCSLSWIYQSQWLQWSGRRFTIH